jgi:extradiol dioxygenase family protein
MALMSCNNRYKSTRERQKIPTAPFSSSSSFQLILGTILGPRKGRQIRVWVVFDHFWNLSLHQKRVQSNDKLKRKL